MELTAMIREEEGGYWAEVKELPGCFASGDSLDELREALEEAVLMYLEGEGAPAELSGPADTHSMRVERIQVLVT